MENKNISSESSIKYITLDIDGKKVDVLEYMPLAIQASLLDNYFAALQDENIPLHQRLLFAEAALELGIIDLMTNVVIDENFSLDEFNNSVAFDKITEAIKNYWDFFSILALTRDIFLDDATSKQSLGSKIDSLLDNLNSVLVKIKDIDLDKDSLKELVETLQNAQKEFNEKWAIEPAPKAIEKEASKVAKATTTRKPRKKAVKGEEQN